ncbi:excinuclease ABC subunit UvrC [Desulfurobacterium atlanticum]|uniref:UvrABC system protein C n=1 Tax=Desulfurobacterium atlanticum TaxID=240169 RepID=A0A238Y0E2_9BACT|nr:excinuclease ABC subunit UvrC [Desulfurobacterium atlanticum]SNR64776.1 Excinuclease ABC subunit C [Desulfurobacterium atlanticum]
MGFKELEEKIKTVPDAPGVYLFYGSTGDVIYVGKAKSLRKRLTSHLRATDPSDKSYRIVQAAVGFDFILVRNEREALALEAELIKKHFPKFNVLMKDDKTYPYLLLTEEDYPTVRIVRKTEGNLKGKLFGPFIPPKNARLMAELIHKIFRIRKCKELKERNKPCIQYHIERCSAPCSKFVSKSDYMEQVKGALSFLEGNVKQYLNTLYEQIEELALRQEFERAAFLRDQFIAIKNLYEKYAVFMDEYKDCDIFYLEERGGVFDGIHFIVRHGVITGKEEFLFDPFEPWETGVLKELLNSKVDKDVIGTIWIKHYFEKGALSDTVFTNFSIVDSSLTVSPLEIPERMLSIVLSNRKKYRSRAISVDISSLSKDYEAVFLDSFPDRIEVFDISTLQGEATVASCIVWERGLFRKDEYRRYKIKRVEGVNDYASMEEVLSRRFKSIVDGKIKVPSLVLIDGGVGQLNVAIKIRDAYGLKFRIFSIAKREEIVYTDDGEVVETKKFPSLYRFFTSLRDEAHRFAITYNRNLRTKILKKSIFDGIKGLGIKRRRILEKFYPDVKELLHVTIDELKNIGIPEKVAVKVIERVREVYRE